MIEAHDSMQKFREAAQVRIADLESQLATERRAHEETKAVVARMAEALRAVQHNRTCSCYAVRSSGPCPRCIVGYDEVDAALVAFAAVGAVRVRKENPCPQ